MVKPKSIKTADVERIVSCLHEQDKLIFRVSVESGLRISDVLNLRAWDLDKTINVREKKTKKHRVVTLSDELYECLKPLKAEAIRNNDKELYAFKSKNKRNKSIHRSTYHRHLKKVCGGVGVDFSAHSARKLFAQELFASTGDIFLVQKALNHKFISDTCIYLDLNFNELIRAAATDAKQLQSF